MTTVKDAILNRITVLQTCLQNSPNKTMTGGFIGGTIDSQMVNELDFLQELLELEHITWEQRKTALSNSEKKFQETIKALAEMR